jgi:hypothetical protein
MLPCRAESRCVDLELHLDSFEAFEEVAVERSDVVQVDVAFEVDVTSVGKLSRIFTTLAASVLVSACTLHSAGVLYACSAVESLVCISSTPK